jgi:hypothetical protein
MNTHIRVVGLLTIALCAMNAQAYKYSVANHTANEHEVFVKFQDVLGILAGEGALGTVKGGGGTASKNFDFKSGRLLQCIMPQLRIDKDSVPLFPVSQSQLNDMLMMKDNPKMLADYMANNKIRPAPTFLCFDRIFFIFPGKSGTYVVVTPTGF